MITSELFLQSIKKLLNNFEQKKFLLAASGGVDSMVLASLFEICNLKFEIAHINYKLRGEDSDSDQKLVEDFCFKNNIKFHLYPVSEKDKKPENSIQLWARNLRYDFFFKILKEENLDYIVTAHHLNDELETFLINLSRGSGIKGLSGIPSNENKIIRPLLNFSKEEIYAFAKENKIEFQEDLSNQKNDYLRNEIRNKIIPEITAVSTNFLNGFKDSLSYLNDANNFIQSSIENAFSDIIIKEDKVETLLNLKKLLSKEPFIITEIIRKFGFSGDEIGKVISAENGKFFRSKTHEIKITRDEILCSKRKEK
ncbi:MAG: tRNA lysidine(34) synthetase TilS [Flavobacteriales bacterium]|nr:tRNA lysidine(34) synthetase TilS [Flavobacteriales bacterium]MCA0391413.1 tRNA lysidine(34) synthetase TilS [Bacteroidota bacterium]